jgi:hypothetical protein
MTIGEILRREDNIQKDLCFPQIVEGYEGYECDASQHFYKTRGIMPTFQYPGKNVLDLNITNAEFVRFSELLAIIYTISLYTY